jgi:hypothetical protein
MNLPKIPFYFTKCNLDNQGISQEFLLYPRKVFFSDVFGFENPIRFFSLFYFTSKQTNGHSNLVLNPYFYTSTQRDKFYIFGPRFIVSVCERFTAVVKRSPEVF